MPGPKYIRVFVASPHALIRDLVRAALSHSHDIELLVDSDNVADLERCASTSEPPDVILVDTMGFLEHGRADVVVTFMEACPAAAVVVLVRDEDDPALLDSLDLGACGFVTAHSTLAAFANSLRAAASRETVLSASLARKMLARMRKGKQDNSAPELTERELAVLQLVARGAGNQEAANRLGVSANTVKNHLYSAYKKLGVASRSQAVAEAVSRGLLKL